MNSSRPPIIMELAFVSVVIITSLMIANRVTILIMPEKKHGSLPPGKIPTDFHQMDATISLEDV